MKPSNERRYGNGARSGTSRVIVPNAPISNVLVAPVTLLTDTSTTAGFGITIGQHVSIAHHAFEMKTAAGTLIMCEPPDGGIVVNNGFEIRAYHAKGDTAYGSIFGPVDQNSAPYIEIPDAGSGSGRIRIYGGQNLPSQNTICNTSAAAALRPRVGDLYWRQRAAGSAQVVYICSTAGTAGTPQGVWTQVI